uniref:Uncharacterized protein n=1 Tax=Cacopsylla melanoneura TaxID=428564 RepID=A0A8D8TZ74_9HEMI
MSKSDTLASIIFFKLKGPLFFRLVPIIISSDMFGSDPKAFKFCLILVVRFELLDFPEILKDMEANRRRLLKSTKHFVRKHFSMIHASLSAARKRAALGILRQV